MEQVRKEVLCLAKSIDVPKRPFVVVLGELRRRDLHRFSFRQCVKIRIAHSEGYGDVFRRCKGGGQAAYHQHPY